MDDTPNDASPDDPGLEDLYAEADYLHQAMVALARSNANVFSEMVLRDEETGGPVRQTAYHCEWNRLLDEHDRLILLAHIESAKTTAISVARTLFEIGRNPLLRVAIVSNTHEQAAKILRTIGKLITDSDAVREIFPALEPDDTLPWTHHSLYLRRPTPSRDPSIQSCGVHGNILGSRVDYLVLDDVLDHENVRTAQQRDELWRWYHSTLSGRLTGSARVVGVGTAWNDDDLYHRLAKTPQWRMIRFPVLRDDASSAWPARWPLERIERKREELGSVEFARQLLCRPHDDSASLFKRAWMESGLARGRGKPFGASVPEMPYGARVITGVDLAVSKSSGADLTVLFTILVHGDGSRQILNIVSGRLGGPEIIQRIQEVHRRYGGTVIVEDNNSQRYLVQMLQANTAIPVRGCTTTGQNKSRPEWGIQQIAVELENGKWIIPNDNGKCHPEIDAWMQELLFYTPEAHSGDRLMANFMALQGIRMGEVFAEQGHLGLQNR